MESLTKQFFVVETDLECSVCASYHVVKVEFSDILMMEWRSLLSSDDDAIADVSDTVQHGL
jgi:hypothetical protein